MSPALGLLTQGQPHRSFFYFRLSKSIISGHNYQESKNHCEDRCTSRYTSLIFRLISDLVCVLRTRYFLANKGIDMLKSLSGQLGDRFLTPVGPSDDPLDGRVPASVGSHCILELYDCNKTLLNDANFIRRSLREAATQAKATLLNEVLHQFEPQGITALALLSESHISVHTWPEVGYAALDVFTCGHHTDPEEACRYLIEAFQSGRHAMTKLRRNPPPMPLTLSLNEQAPVVMDELACSVPA